MKSTGTKEQYAAAFDAERQMIYPAIDAFEKTVGYQLHPTLLQSMAHDLACPVKVNPPNWQHGRVLYALARAYAAEHPDPLLLDIGTAKGFSACVMAWALQDAGRTDGAVVSIDIVDPAARAPRNSVAELDGLKTVEEFVRPFAPPRPQIKFIGGGSFVWLSTLAGGTRIGLAFVDGKHVFERVRDEALAIKKYQRAGDVILFDDLQIPDIEKAVATVKGYRIDYLAASDFRRYAIATKQ